jgi:hypothetical protein
MMGADSRQTMNSLNAEINTYLNRVIQDLKVELTRETPKKTGRASRGWRQSGRYDVAKQGEQEILRNDTPYVALLEEGRSKQAPHGMINPSIEAVLRRNNKR